MSALMKFNIWKIWGKTRQTSYKVPKFQKDDHPNVDEHFLTSKYHNMQSNCFSLHVKEANNELENESYDTCVSYVYIWEQ